MILSRISANSRVTCPLTEIGRKVCSTFISPRCTSVYSTQVYNYKTVHSSSNFMISSTSLLYKKTPMRSKRLHESAHVKVEEAKLIGDNGITKNKKQKHKLKNLIIECKNDELKNNIEMTEAASTHGHQKMEQRYQEHEEEMYDTTESDKLLNGNAIDENNDEESEVVDSNEEEDDDDDDGDDDDTEIDKMMSSMNNCKIYKNKERKNKRSNNEFFFSDSDTNIVNHSHKSKKSLLTENKLKHLTLSNSKRKAKERSVLDKSPFQDDVDNKEADESDNEDNVEYKGDENEDNEDDHDDVSDENEQKGKSKSSKIDAPETHSRLLKDHFHDLASEYTAAADNNTTPLEQVEMTSAEVASWRCPACLQIWKCGVFVRCTLRNVCPYCNSVQKTCLATLYPELAKLWDYAQNDPFLTPDNVQAESKTAVYWMCPVCNQSYLAKVRDMVKDKAKCPTCMTAEKSRSANWDQIHSLLLQEWHPLKNGDLHLDQVDKEDFKTKVWWLCSLCGHDWQASAARRCSSRRTQGSVCPACNGRGLLTEEIIEEHRERAQDTRNL